MNLQSSLFIRYISCKSCLVSLAYISIFSFWHCLLCLFVTILLRVLTYYFEKNTYHKKYIYSILVKMLRQLNSLTIFKVICTLFFLLKNFKLIAVFVICQADAINLEDTEEVGQLFLFFLVCWCCCSIINLSIISFIILIGLLLFILAIWCYVLA